MHEKDPATAIKLLTAAIAKAPGDAQLRMSLGMVYATQERWDDAFATYDAILVGDAGNMAALYQVGRTAALSGKRLDQGKSALERYLKATPGPDAPPLANAHFHLGMIYQHQGNKTAARAEYQAALRLDPKLKGAKEALDKLG
jgi:tetratricopeptide (TPR) repeat protein